MRLDLYLSELEGLQSRSKATHLIKMNRVLVNGKVCTKPSTDVSGKLVEVSSNHEYVSMGGYKLAHAIKEYNIDILGSICLDIGASNGGFTHCLLQNGASKVYALDVGDCALPQALIEDSRVIVKDRFNARDLTSSSMGELVDVVVIDVSFISLELVLLTAIETMKSGAIMIALIKPQFEVGKKHLSKKGIVVDMKARNSAVDRVVASSRMLGLDVIGTIAAPVREGKNTEYLLYARKIK